jgi:OOP family OmpA-OmpF porin
MMHVIDGVLLPSDLDPTAALPAASVDANFTEAGAALTGVVADEAVRDMLVAAVGNAASDELVIDPASGLDAVMAQTLVPLIVAARDHLAAGSAGFDGDTFFISGSYAADADRDALIAAGESAGIDATLTPAGATTVTTSTTSPPDDDTVAAEALEDELNAVVRSDPILFETNRSTIASESDAVLDQIAEMIDASEDVTVVVEGHTDSDGDANDNLWLSRFRARAVRDALVARGVSEATVTWEGFGSQHPILVDGVEDKTASRRVEFRVETAG